MVPAMTVDEIIEECKKLFFASKETLTSLLNWAVVSYRDPAAHLRKY
jgi:cytochrome P450